jgi:hypothetical protein
MNISAACRLAAACLSVAGIAACGSSSNRGGGFLERLLPHHFSAAASAIAGGAAGQEQAAPAIDDDMVEAVSSAKSDDLPVQVRFALRERPEIGKSSELDLVMIPSAPLDRLITVFHAEDGLSVSAGAEPTQRDRPEPGVPIRHRLTIVPQRDGIFYVTATVLVDSASGSVARTFTIPVIAGTGTP